MGIEIPSNVRLRNEPPLRCYYCALPDVLGMRKPVQNSAVATIHDKRGCFHVCFEHARWRLTTSFLFGHSPDCPYYREGQ